jgi:hypothetical protein
MIDPDGMHQGSSIPRTYDPGVPWATSTDRGDDDVSYWVDFFNPRQRSYIPGDPHLHRPNNENGQIPNKFGIISGNSGGGDGNAKNGKGSKEPTVVPGENGKGPNDNILHPVWNGMPYIALDDVRIHPEWGSLGLENPKLWKDNPGMWTNKEVDDWAFVELSIVGGEVGGEFFGWGARGLGRLFKGADVVAESTNVIENATVHGNSLKSLKPTWGYKLFSEDGTFLKNGITSAVKAESRYTKAFMETHYMELEPIFPNRQAAWDWEYLQNQIQRGPLNLNMH